MFKRNKKIKQEENKNEQSNVQNSKQQNEKKGFKSVFEKAGITGIVDDVKNYYGIGVSNAFNNFSNKINSLFIDREFFDEQFFEDFEEKLVELDIIPILAVMLRNKLEQRILNQKVDKNSFKQEMQKVIVELVNLDINNELVINKEAFNTLLIIGVNGVGKTTTISKLIHKYKKDYNLEVVAADTFRAGAIEQLNEWAKRENVPITKTHQGHAPSAVVYNGIQSAVENNRDLLICDTAGRLHNKDELMQELKKIHGVINKYPQMEEDINKDYNVKTILVLDSTAGKNTIEQAKAFNDITDIDGIIITKMDAGGKAGMIINLAYELNKPVYFLTNGEDVSSLVKFDYNTYVDLLLGE